MKARSAAQRFAGALYVALSIALSGALPVLEARAIAESPVSHVESPTEAKCPPTHDHLACNFCRVLRQLSRGEPALPADFIVRGSIAAPQPHVESRAAGGPTDVTRSRAPPV